VRIISGKYRGRQIVAPAGLPARPTTDFAKTGLFNILNNRVDFENITVLDLFSGTGNITYEFISRGCTRITAVDADKNCIRFIENTGMKLNAAGLRVIKSDAFHFLADTFLTFGVIFADPPFDMPGAEKLHELIFRNNILDKNGLFVLEHPSGKNYSNLPNHFDTRKYGHVSFSFFKSEN